MKDVLGCEDMLISGWFESKIRFFAREKVYILSDSISRAVRPRKQSDAGLENLPRFDSGNPFRARASAQTQAANLPASLSHNLFTESLRLTSAFHATIPCANHSLILFPAFLKPRVDSRQVCRVTLNKHGGQRLLGRRR